MYLCSHMYNLYICTLGNVQDRPSTVAALVDWCVEWELSARVTPVSNQPIGGKMHKMRLRMQTLHGANAPLCVFRYHFPYHTTSEKPTTTSIQTVKQQQQQQHPHCSQIHAILQCMHKKALDLSPPPASSWVQFLWHLHRMRWLRYKRESIHRYVNATTLSSSYRCSWLLSLHSYVAASTYTHTHQQTLTQLSYSMFKSQDNNMNMLMSTRVKICKPLSAGHPLLHSDLWCACMSVHTCSHRQPGERVEMMFHLY